MPVDRQHDEMTVARGIHIIHAFEEDDVAGMNALSVGAVDVGKVCRVGYRYYVLAEYDPSPYWLELTGAWEGVIYSWYVDDETERLALPVVTGDVGKVAFQADTLTFWFLAEVGVESDTWRTMITEDQADQIVQNATDIVTLLSELSAIDAQIDALELFSGARNQLLFAAINPFSGTAFAPVPGGGVIGTTTMRAPDNTGYGARRSRIGYVTASGAGNSALVLFYSAYAGNQGYFSRETGFAVRTGTVLHAVATNFAWLLGIEGAPTFHVLTPSVRLNCFMVGADAADANAQIMHNDGSGACTKIDLGANFPARTAGDFYDLLLWCAPGSSTLNYVVTRHSSGGTAFTASGTVNTNVPAAGTQFYVVNGCSNGTGGVCGIDSVGFNLAVPY